jgi:hypothetical protein
LPKHLQLRCGFSNSQLFRLFASGQTYLFFTYKINIKAYSMCQVLTTCFSKHNVCLKRPSLKLLDSLLQEVCITYTYFAKASPA